MSARTYNELSTIVREDLASRRKEVVFYHALVEKADPGKKQPSLRGAIAVLYAHWEGFVKTALQEYVDFVRSQKATVAALNDAFVAMAAKKYLTSLFESRRPGPHAECARWFLTQSGTRAHLPDRKIISTQSNLSVDVLKDLVGLVGLDYHAKYAAAEKPVIERLLQLRNHVAHGEWKLLDEEEWKTQLYPKIDELLVLVCEQVEDAAARKKYLR